MRIVHSGWFLEEGFRKVGCEVTPLQLDATKTINELVEEAGVVPDVVFIELFGRTSLPRELHNCRYPLAAYCIDSPLNEYWYIPLMKLFNFVYVDQLSSLPKFRRNGIHAHWLPLCVSEADFRPATEKQYEITFVGRMTAHRTKRTNLINHIKKQFPLNVVDGVSRATMLDTFAASRIVLNENFFSGLTLRFFQALASGSLLLTERRGYGVRQHFQEGEHFIGYSPNDIIATITHIEQAFDCFAPIAAAGQQECMLHHTSECRAGSVVASLTSGALPPVRSLFDRQMHEGQSKYFHTLRFGGRFEEPMKLLEESTREPGESASNALGLLGSIHLRAGDIESGVACLEQCARTASVHGLNATLKLMLLFADDTRHFKYLALLLSILKRLGMDSHKYLPHIKKLKDKHLQYYNTCLLGHEILHDTGCNHALGFNKPDHEMYPDYAIEYAHLAFTAHKSQDSLSAIIKSTKDAGIAPEALSYIKEAICAGAASDEQIALSISLALEYYDYIYASTAVKSLKRTFP